MAGIENAFRASVLGGSNCVAVLPDRLFAEDVHRDNQNLFSAFEGFGQSRGICEIAPGHSNATLLKISSLFRIANAHRNLSTW